MNKALRSALLPAALGAGLLLAAPRPAAAQRFGGSFRGGSRSSFGSGRGHFSAPMHSFGGRQFGGRQSFGGRQFFGGRRFGGRQFFGGRHFGGSRFFGPRHAFFGNSRFFFRTGGFVPFGFSPRFFPGFGFGFFAPASFCGFDDFDGDFFVPVRPFGARFVISGRPFAFRHGRRFSGR